MADPRDTQTTPAAAGDGYRDPEAVRVDMDDGLRFLNILGMQTKHDVFEVSTRLFALIEELVAAGALDMRRFDERRERVKKRENERLKEQAVVQIAPPVDKYHVTDLPDIDCASLIPICRSRCCALSFPLSFQDLDERSIQWNYARPYLIRKKDDGSCVHNDAETGACGVYEQRPTICRQYDCRQDQRIWVDFERRIPASGPVGDAALIPAERLSGGPEAPGVHPGAQMAGASGNDNTSNR